MEKKKRAIWHAAVCLVLLCVIWGGYFVSVKKITVTRKIAAVNEQEEVVDYDILAQIESVNVVEDRIDISGWALRLESMNTDVCVILHSNDETDDIVLLSKCVERADIEKRINPEWDFGNCGFVVDVKQSELEKDIGYEILLSLSYKDAEGVQRAKKISTNKYLKDGQLYSYNPTNYVKPDVNDGDIQEVVDKGVVKSYDAQKGAWLYLYNSTLYWIIDYQIIGELKWRPEVPLFLYTYDINSLPEERQQYKSDYIGRYLNEEDYSCVTEKYFIYSYTLQEKYPITYIRTGLCHNDGDAGWIWKANILNDVFNEVE